MLLLLLPLLGLLAGRAHGQDGPPPTLYRAAAISPDDLERQQMFLPRGADGSRPNQPPADTSLFNHVEGTQTGMGRTTSGYVSTTSRLDYAQRFISSRLNGRGYIYEIHVSANFVDAAATLGHFYRRPAEAEHAALGGIHFTQVVGWTEYREGVAQRPRRNPRYDHRFDAAVGGGAQPQLAGFPANHRAWSLDPWRAFASCTSSVLGRRRGGGGGGQQGRCQPNKSARSFAAGFLADARKNRAALGPPLPARDACDHVTDLKLLFVLADDLAAGTWTTIEAGWKGPSGSTAFVSVAKAPSAGFHKVVSIDRGAFADGVIDITQPQKLRLRDVGSGLFNDQWKLRGALSLSLSVCVCVCLARV